MSLSKISKWEPDLGVCGHCGSAVVKAKYHKHYCPVAAGAPRWWASSDALFERVFGLVGSDASLAVNNSVGNPNFKKSGAI
jgi:hypothetical protein